MRGELAYLINLHKEGKISDSPLDKVTSQLKIKRHIIKSKSDAS